MRLESFVLSSRGPHRIRATKYSNYYPYVGRKYITSF